MNEVEKFDLYEDRAISLLTRWKEFLKKHPNITAKEAVENFQRELNDEFSESILE